MRYEELFDYLADVERRVLAFFDSSDVRTYFRPADIAEGVVSYISRPAKRLRPAVMLMAAGALGGNDREAVALPAAAGLELFHTWTLVHDDVIDEDTLRRGGPTVHEAMRQLALERDALPAHLAVKYGRDMAILTGDAQHGWSMSCFIDCALQAGVDPTLVLKVIRHLQSYVLGNLVYGEVLDVQYSLRDLAELEGVDETKIVEMLWLKTGVLYEFAGMSGALIGKNTCTFDDQQVQAITRFASKCGAAFQLQDDILGIVGDQASLGKPVGSDIREGKKTVIVYEALKKADESQRSTLLSTLGNRHATPEEIQAVTELFCELNGVQRAKELAIGCINEALPYLDPIPDSQYKRLLTLWAHYMLDREF